MSAPIYRFFPIAVPAGQEIACMDRLQAEGFTILSAAPYIQPTNMNQGMLMCYILSRIPVNAPETPLEKEVKEFANRKIIT